MEDDKETLLACWSALGAVVVSIPKELQPSYVRCMREAVQTAREKERRKRKPAPLLLPGFCLPKALQPVLPIYLQGVLQVGQLFGYITMFVPAEARRLACMHLIQRRQSNVGHALEKHVPRRSQVRTCSTNMCLSHPDAMDDLFLCAGLLC